MGKFVTSDFFNNNPGPKVTEGLSDLRNNQSAVLELPFSTPPADVTILDDNILPTSAILHVDTEGGASNDELRTITYQLSESETWHDGGVLWLKAKDPARKVTLVNSQTVNGVQTVDGKNIVLSDKYYTTLQLRSGTWYQVKHYQEIYSGASASLSGTSGLVPPASAGDQNKVLHGDGTWKVAEASEAQVSEFVGLVDGLRQDVPELAAHAAGPSMKKIDFDVSQQSGTYLTQADGYVFFICQASVQNSWIALTIQGTNLYISAFIPVASGILTVWLPVSKGQTVTFSSSALSAFTSRAGYFYYSNGNAPSA